MKTGLIVGILVTLGIPVFAATGMIQIYCESGTLIYINDRIAGKTQEAMSGLYIEDVEVGDVTVRAYKKGYDVYIKQVYIEPDKITEITIELQQPKKKITHHLGMELHFGGFGLFNVNDVFSKSRYTLGFTPFYEIQFQKHLAAGLECNFVWGQPDTQDTIRYFFNPNLRFHILFSPLPKLNVDILLAGGLSQWPSNGNTSYLTPTYNDKRNGWNVRAMAGVELIITERIAVFLHLGYFASSSTSDSEVWITHDMMLITLGSKAILF
jgi:hypothetical protein